MELKQVIKESLGIPVVEGFSPIHPPCATYYLVSDNSVLVGDGESTEETESYQIDIWCRNRTEVCRLTRMLNTTLINIKGNTIPTVSYYYDNNGKTWRGNLFFEHLRED